MRLQIWRYCAGKMGTGVGWRGRCVPAGVCEAEDGLGVAEDDVLPQAHDHRDLEAVRRRHVADAGVHGVRADGREKRRVGRRDGDAARPQQPAGAVEALRTQLVVPE